MKASQQGLDQHIKQSLALQATEMNILQAFRDSDEVLDNCKEAAGQQGTLARFVKEEMK